MKVLCQLNKIVWLGLVTVAQFLSWLTPKNQAGLINKLRSEKIYNVIEKNDHSWKTITCTRSKNIKMKLYVQCSSTRSVRHIYWYLQGFLGLYCCWLSRGSEKARFSDSGVLNALLTPSSSSSSSSSTSSSSSSQYSGTEQNEITHETIENNWWHRYLT